MNDSKRRLINFATLTAVLISPLVYLYLGVNGMSPIWAAILTLLGIAAFRGMLDLLFKRFIITHTLGLDSTPDDQEFDALWRRRTWFWYKKLRLFIWLLGLNTTIWFMRGGDWFTQYHWVTHGIARQFSGQILVLMLQLPFLFFFNFLIFMGPLMFSGISQIKAYEPGDADWGVKLADVRGQKEAKEEIRKIITLWQSGDEFVKAGGKRERGILFLGAPGVGKTMLAKGIATGFNCPIVTIPGSGFAQTFIGLDVLIVRWLAMRARKLARKWGGQCLIFIDEIDAVGMRRASLGNSANKYQIPGGAMGGMAINQLLIVMDGIDSPPFVRKILTNKINLWLDVLYVIPRSLGKFPLRLPKPRPQGTEIYFIGATNVPLESLDPALTRPGRMGRHIYFRMPTKNDRIDIFDLYLTKITHDPELDSPEAREELARITDDYSPAKIEQVCNLALTYAQHSGREAFGRSDVLEAMVTLEAGTALGWGYEREAEHKSVAIHEVGHAICSYLYMNNVQSTRLSIRRRGETGGHHQVAAEQESVFSTRDELFADLVWGLGSYAAETVFFGQNTQGVGGDLSGVSYSAGNMVGRWGMVAPEINLTGTVKQKEKVWDALEEIGKKLLTVAQPGDTELSEEKYLQEAILVGQAYVVAYETVVKNKVGIEKISERLLREEEMFGQDVVDVLKSAGLEKPDIDWDTAPLKLV